VLVDISLTGLVPFVGKDLRIGRTKYYPGIGLTFSLVYPKKITLGQA